MKDDQDRFENDMNTRRGRLDKNRNRPSDEIATGVAGEPLPHEEIIDLVDVVLEGESVQDQEDDDLILSLEEDPEQSTFFDERPEGDSYKSSLTLEQEPGKDSGADYQDRDGSLDSLDFGFEISDDVTETGPSASSEPYQEGFGGTGALPELELEKERAEPEIIDERLPPISPERLEEIITEAVRDIVERVTRETMAEVAERVIKEAIESLKKSIE